MVSGGCDCVTNVWTLLERDSGYRYGWLSLEKETGWLEARGQDVLSSLFTLWYLLNVLFCTCIHYLIDCLKTKEEPIRPLKLRNHKECSRR